MRLLASVLLLGAAFVGVGQAATFAELAAELPTCGLTCFETALSESTCSLTNATCICTDTALLASATACISVSCTVKEQLQVAHIEYEGCGVPQYNRQAELRGVTVAFFVLAEVCIILRIWARLKVANTLGADDWVIILAGVASIPYLCILLALTDLGLGLNLWDADLDQLNLFFRLFWAEEIVYLNFLAITKISLLLLIVRIFPTPRIRLACWILGGLTFAIALSFIMVTIFSCNPISYFWTQWQGDTSAGTCNNESLQTQLAGGINIIQDFAILVLPLPELYKLQVDRKKKLLLLMMFCVGFFVSIISIIRLKFLVVYGDTANPTKDYVGLVIWSIIEGYLAVVCACMPAIRQLFAHSSFFSTISKSISKSVSKSVSKSASHSTDPRIYQSRSFKIESKRRSQNDDFYELTSVINGNGNASEIASDHTSGNLNAVAEEGEQHMTFGHDEEKGTAQIHRRSEKYPPGYYLG